MGQEAIIKKSKETNLTCLATVKWGERQTKISRKLQEKMISDEDWEDKRS